MNNNVTISSNKFFEANCYRTINGTNVLMENVVKSNILADYKVNGVRDASLSLFITNLKHINGSQAKVWKNGEVLKINDIVQIDGKDGDSLFMEDTVPIYFRVTGRTIGYDGQPLMDIELREIKFTGGD